MPRMASGGHSDKDTTGWLPFVVKYEVQSCVNNTWRGFSLWLGARNHVVLVDDMSVFLVVTNDMHMDDGPYRVLREPQP